jgi:uncharacterized protein (TIGR02145 family)/uncharacterized repeat protein (TIGR02543 family)
MKNLILRMAVILTAAAALFYSGCNDSADSDITGGGHVDDLIEKTRGTNEPKAYTLKVTVSPTAGGSVSKSPDKAQYSKGESVMLTATAKAGYRFTGWSGSQTSTGVEVLVKMDGNKELIANFLPENAVSYTLTINTSPTAGGSVSKSPDKLEYAAGDMVYVVAAPKPGYAFTIWSGASSSRDSAITITMNDKKELTANFAPRTYTLTVKEENGGTVSRNPGKSAYEYNEKVIVTAYPDNGYKFKEWSGAATGTKNPVTVTIDGDKTLTASFEWNGATPPPNVPDTKYTLTAYPSPTNGGEVSRSPDKNAYTSGEKVTVTANPANGYKFTGWSDAATSTSKSITVTIDGDRTLTAGFELITYTVTFSANGGSGTIPDRSAQSGNSITLPTGSNLSKNGSTFGGWNTNASGTGTNYGGGSSFFVTKDVTLYAEWEIIPTYTVTFNANGGTVNPTSAKTEDDGKLASLPTPTRNGYTFDGWYTASTGGSEVLASRTYSANTTIYARWTEVPVTPSTYTITFNASGGTVSPTSAKTGDDGKLASLPTPTRSSDYTFNGWYTAATGGTVVTESRQYSATTTIYAQWTPVTYTITYDLDGGTVSSPNPTSYSVETTNFTLRNPTKTGYTFAGWTGTNGTTPQTTVSIQIGSTGSRNYTANWTLIPYTVTFNVNNGSGSVSSQNVQPGSSITLPSQGSLTRTGYTFGGWNTNSSGTGTNYNAGDSYTPTASITLYAKWYIPAPTITMFIDSRDGKTYKKVVIGTQTWMAENLNYSATGSMCYGNNADSCAKYGRLYNWNTAMDGASSSAANPSEVRGVCPADWHLPSDAEWTTLRTFVGETSTAGTKLKSPNYWRGFSGIPASTDEYGFSALPGGYGYVTGDYYDATKKGGWWSATEDNASGAAWYWYMPYDSEFLGRYYYGKIYLFSVRCVED